MGQGSHADLVPSAEDLPYQAPLDHVALVGHACQVPWVVDLPYQDPLDHAALVDNAYQDPLDRVDPAVGMVASHHVVLVESVGRMDDVVTLHPLDPSLEEAPLNLGDRPLDHDVASALCQVHQEGQEGHASNLQAHASNQVAASAQEALVVVVVALLALAACPMVEAAVQALAACQGASYRAEDVLERAA